MIEQTELVVAQRKGTHLFLSQSRGKGLQYEHLGDRTLLFRRESAALELERRGVPTETFLLRPAKLVVDS